MVDELSKDGSFPGSYDCLVINGVVFEIDGVVKLPVVGVSVGNCGVLLYRWGLVGSIGAGSGEEEKEAKKDDDDETCGVMYFFSSKQR